MKKFLVFLLKFLSYVVLFAAIFGISAYGGYLYITPSGYVVLNGDPYVKYSVNNFNRVIKVETDNDTEVKLENLDLMHKDITDAVQLTIDELNAGGYLSKYRDKDFIISVSYKDAKKGNSLTEKLNSKIRVKYGDESGDKIKGIVVRNK